MSILDGIADKTALIQFLWPAVKAEGPGVWRIGGIDAAPGTSGKVFESGYWFDHNGDQKGDMVDVIMERYSLDHAGAARWLADNGWVTGRYAKQRPRPKTQAPAVLKAAPTTRVENCTDLGDGITLQDFYNLPCWVPATGKKVHYRWRHSLGESTGGTVQLARFGGMLKGQTIRPWLTLADCQAAIAGGLTDCRPAFALSGDDSSPAPHDLLCLDMDYHPCLDPAGMGAAARDRLAQVLQDFGATVFRSTSGNGCHVVARLTAQDIKSGKLHYRARPIPGYGAGRRASGIAQEYNLERPESRDIPCGNPQAFRLVPEPASRRPRGNSPAGTVRPEHICRCTACPDRSPRLISNSQNYKSSGCGGTQRPLRTPRT